MCPKVAWPSSGEKGTTLPVLSIMRGGWIMATAAVFLFVLAWPALAAAGGKGPSEVVFIAQLVALMLTGRLLGEAMIRMGQPAVMGQLIAGLLLGPSFLGFVWPDFQHALFPQAPEQKAMLQGISEAGILLLLLLTGMETDLRLVRATGKASVYASLMGIVVPFGFGVTLGYFLPDNMLPHPDHRLITALFLGTALSIASVKIVAMVVREMNFMRRNVGQVILAAAIIDDSVGWIIVSIIFSLAMHGEVDAWSLAQSVVGTFVFMVLSLTIGRRLVFFAIRWANDVLKSEFAVVTAILIIMSAMALTTHFIGVHSVLGAFVAGILVGESPILTKHIDEQLRGLITAFFAPVFFGVAGLSADLTILADPEIAIATVGLIVIASVGKFGGAFIGAELGGLTRREGFALACGMNARGSTEVIIATVGLTMGALTQNLFTMIVTMAVVTTLAMPPTLRWALSRIPLSKEEKQRLEREEVESQGFLANLERLLLAVDDSTNGTFATRLGGIVAATHEMPTTVIHITDGDIDDKKVVKQEAAKAKDAAGIVQEVAERAETTKAPEDQSLLKLEVSTLVGAPSTDAIAEEAKKGYGAMIVGLDKMVARTYQFEEAVTRLSAGFEGPLFIADAREEHRKHPLHGTISILLPVNGTEVSRRAAEVAIAIARATKAPVTALYVAPDGKARSRRAEEAILKDIAALADSYAVDVRTAVRTEKAAGEAILKEAARRKHNVIILGAGRRPGEKLFFGDTASALLEKSQQSLVFVVT